MRSEDGRIQYYERGHRGSTTGLRLTKDLPDQGNTSEGRSLSLHQKDSMSRRKRQSMGGGEEEGETSLLKKWGQFPGKTAAQFAENIK